MKFESKKVSLFILVLVVLCYSCSPYKQIPYFQDLDRNSITKEGINNYSPLIIQPGDLLAINVASPSQGAEQFGYNLQHISGTTGDSKNPENTVIGFLVDLNGNINLPFLGQTKASGLNINNLTEQLQNSLTKFFINPIVNIRILNFKIL